MIDARLQLHHAAQIPVSLGISLIKPEADDSHTNLEWLHNLHCLATRSIETDRGSVRAAISPDPFSLMFLVDDEQDATFALSEQTCSEGFDWLRSQLRNAGADVFKFTSKKHYKIPPHRVAMDAPFNPDTGSLKQLAEAYDYADATLRDIERTNAGASEVRCWPHHFDIATLITLHVHPAVTIGVGMSPGDDSYPEPYWYVTPWPYPKDALPPTLAASGEWRTDGWYGAVRPYAAPGDTREFLSSALQASRELIAQATESG